MQGIKPLVFASKGFEMMYVIVAVFPPFFFAEEVDGTSQNAEM